MAGKAKAEARNEDIQVSRLTSESIDNLTDPKAIVQWMNATRRLPYDAIEDTAVDLGYPAVVWLFRRAAITGNVQQAKACEMWLRWAQPIVARSKEPDKERDITPKQFLPSQRGSE